ncbi:MAG: ADP-ribosylglycohydrolase family protein [Burkholderiaceae bacterium]|jgi:ADP-ribosyl-[dinitrogen reductase] hydrolase|nr:ADP-ribosylglycohydrolase family protein [Burkholderiaceae bacterium]
MNDAREVPPTRRERFRATLLGAAIGDALGAPAQFLTPEQVGERWGVLTEMVGGGPHDVAPGETTDATGMMLCLAESLADQGGFAPEDVARRYLAWFQSNPKDVALTVRTALLGIKAGTSLDLASRRAFEVLGSPTAGNASLMRCAPVALCYFTDRQTRRDVSLRESALTHFDRLAGWACAAFNELLAAALAGQLRRRLLPIAAGFDEEDSRVSATLREAAVAEPEEIHSSAAVLDTLKAALWSTLQAHSFEEALVTAVNLGNDSDTTGAVAGALAGALFGERAIPARWLNTVAERERVETVANCLADLAGID